MKVLLVLLINVSHSRFHNKKNVTSLSKSMHTNSSVCPCVCILIIIWIFSGTAFWQQGKEDSSCVFMDKLPLKLQISCVLVNLRKEGRDNQMCQLSSCNSFCIFPKSFVAVSSWWLRNLQLLLPRVRLDPALSSVFPLKMVYHVSFN